MSSSLLSSLLTGLILGLSIAAPVGPIGILCIRRTLAQGLWVGLVSGLGAATADALYGCIAGFGLTAIANVLTERAIWLRIVGGLFLCYLGITTILATPSTNMTPPPSVATSGNASSSTVAVRKGMMRSLLTAYASTLALTLTNPATILSFAAIFAGLGLANADQNFGRAGTLVLGVFCGSALWWVFLSSTVSLFRQWFTPAGLQWLNRLSGGILLAFGVVALAFWRR